jgi:hypothetical protein
VFEARCDGFVELYGRRRGTAGFTPVSRERLRRLDPGQRTFIHQIDAGLRALGGHDLAGWKLVGADDSEFDGWARLFYQDARGGSVELLIVPAARQETSDATHRDFALRVERWTDADVDQVFTLLAAVYERMSAVLGDSAAHLVHAPTREEFRARRGIEIKDGAVPRAIDLRLRRLLRRLEPATGWRLAAATPHAASPGVSVRYEGPPGSSPILHLVEQHGRFSGRWDFSPGARREQRALAIAVGDMLRG